MHVGTRSYQNEDKQKDRADGAAQEHTCFTRDSRPSAVSSTSMTSSTSPSTSSVLFCVHQPRSASISPVLHPSAPFYVHRAPFCVHRTRSGPSGPFCVHQPHSVSISPVLCPSAVFSVHQPFYVDEPSISVSFSTSTALSLNCWLNQKIAVQIHVSLTTISVSSTACLARIVVASVVTSVNRSCSLQTRCPTIPPQHCPVQKVQMKDHADIHFGS